jgi:hypothetical protein
MSKLHAWDLPDSTTSSQCLTRQVYIEWPSQRDECGTGKASGLDEGIIPRYWFGLSVMSLDSSRLGLLHFLQFKYLTSLGTMSHLFHEFQPRGSQDWQ